MNLLDIRTRLELGSYYIGLVCSWRHPGRITAVPFVPSTSTKSRSVLRREAIQREEPTPMWLEPYDDAPPATGIVRPAYVRPAKRR